MCMRVGLSRSTVLEMGVEVFRLEEGSVNLPVWEAVASNLFFGIVRREDNSLNDPSAYELQLLLGERRHAGW